MKSVQKIINLTSNKKIIHFTNDFTYRKVDNKIRNDVWREIDNEVWLRFHDIPHKVNRKIYSLVLK